MSATQKQCSDGDIECNKQYVANVLYGFSTDKIKGTPQDSAVNLNINDSFIRTYTDNSNLFLSHSSRIADLNELKNVHGYLTQVQRKKLEDMEYSLQHLHNNKAKAEQYYKTDAYKINETVNLISMLKISLVFIAVIFVLGGMTMIDQLKRSTFMILAFVLLAIFLGFFVVSLIVNLRMRNKYNWKKYNFDPYTTQQKEDK